MFRTLQKNLSRRLNELENSRNIVSDVQKKLDRLIPFIKCSVEFESVTRSIIIVTPNKTVATEVSFVLEKITSGLRDDGMYINKIVVR